MNKLHLLTLIMIMYLQSCNFSVDVTENSTAHLLNTAESILQGRNTPVAIYLPDNMDKIYNIPAEIVKENNQLYQYFQSRKELYQERGHQTTLFTNKQEFNNVILFVESNDFIINRRTLKAIKFDIENRLDFHDDSKVEFRSLDGHIEERNNNRMLYICYLIKGDRDIYFSIYLINTPVGRFEVYQYSLEKIELKDYIWSIDKKI